MSPALVVAAVAGWAGAALLLSEIRWATRPSLSERLRRYITGPAPTPQPAGVLSAASFRDVLAPMAESIGTTLSRLFGVNEDLAARLVRVHAPLDVAGFRLRQVAWAAGAAAGALVAAVALGAPPLAGLFLVACAPLLAFLVLENRLAVASKRRQERLFAELPVVTEQLGMLLGAGYSLGAALARLARRGGGACAQDLTRVTNRIRQGLSETDALREWAAIAAVPELDRLVGVLALERQGGDLGRLVAEEARTMRREAHRRTLEIIDRRAQLVWIPVTVATLVPGVMLLAIPFIAALREFAAL